MKNLIIGSFILIASIGRYVFTEKHLATTLILAVVGIVFAIIGATKLTVDEQD